MPSFEGKLYKKVFSTCHRKLLNRRIKAELKKLSGDVLILGAGHLDYKQFFDLNKVNLTQSDLYKYGDHIDICIDANNVASLGIKFDAILMFEVLEHVENQLQVLMQCRESLKPSGKIIFSLPFMFHIHADPSDFVRFTEFGIQHLCKEFLHVKITAFGSRLHVVTDIILTANKYVIPFRILSHIFCLKYLDVVSHKCPSGYFVVLND